MKCDESAKRGSPLEDHLLGKPQPATRKSASIDNGSQLLRRLVSQQTVPRSNGYSAESFPVHDRRQNDSRMQDDPEMEDDEGDGGGAEEGGGDDRCRRSVSASQPSQRNNPPCSSVLMNLLVSGCDVSAGYVCFAKPKPSKSIAST